MTALRQRLLRDESGFALLLALGMTVVLAIAVIAMTSYTSSNLRSTARSRADQAAQGYAEAGLQEAYSILTRANATGSNPAAANLLGCAGAGGSSDTNGPSNCGSPTARVICFAAAAPCAAGAPGTASVFGYFSGVNPAWYGTISVPASTWLLVARGFAADAANGGVAAQEARATVKISPLDSGAVASVWNHIFITAPLVQNVCQLDFGGNGITVNVPVYVIGNLCLSGQNASVQESAAGQPIDMQVGGKLVLSGSGTKVGTDSLHPITSGVVVGGCTTVGVSAATVPCSSTGFSYWVRTTDAFIPNDAPSLSQAQMAANYASFDPGPKHACTAGTLPAPLAASVFDNDTAGNLSNEPNRSAATFELTPGSSYSCISQQGSSVGQLSWDNTTKRLTVNGSIFIDGNLTISHTATYTGTAVLEVAGTVTFNNNGTTVCATGPPCDLVNWQGTSGNRSMLTLAPLASSATAITFTDNSQTFQGSLWTQPSSAMTFLKNGVTVQGPLSVGRFDATFNNATIKALPTIVNMPVGAPIPPNTSASIGPLTYTR